MRTARPVGLTDDGRFIIVQTAEGESISVPVDDELRAMLRNRPQRHLETEMKRSMTPREIQMKIRAGASVDELVDVSGMPATRVEAFAAPVVAERNHIAALAQAGSVRRSGETTGHRTLRVALNERLRERGVNPDSVYWDAYKMDDGRWTVSASYHVDRADKIAIFYFDQRGRFSVSGNSEGRWAIGEQDEPEVLDVADSTDETDSEPTVKLAGPADELALLRAIETNATDDTHEPEDHQPEDHEPQDHEPQEHEPQEQQVDVEREAAPEPEPKAQVETSADETSADEAAIPDEPGQLDLLYDLLGSDGYAEDSIRVFEGLSDAAAVPDVADGGWQKSDAEPSDEPGDQGSDAAADDDASRTFADGAQQDALPGAEPEPETPVAKTKPAAKAKPKPAPEPTPELTPEPADEDTAVVEKPAPKPRKRKRAEVPSWDEIMFGSPSPKRK